MKKAITSPTAPKPAGPYSHGIVAGQSIYCAGQVGLDPATGLLAPGGVKAETKQALTNLMGVLSAAGYSAADVVKTTVFLADLADFAAMNEVYATFFPTDPPARSTVGVSLPRGARVEIELVAWKG